MAKMTDAEIELYRLLLEAQKKEAEKKGEKKK